MARRRVEEEIEVLEQLRSQPPEVSVPALRKALADRVNLVVAKAAKLAGALVLHELVPDLIKTFYRLLEDGAARDPQCWAKNAIARALSELDHRESAVFLRGVRHIQMEPVWEGQADTAGPLRGICLLGLAACSDANRLDLFRALVDGLTDPTHTVRQEAVRAIAQLDGDEASLLLRMKARTGDEEPRVVGQVFDSLLTLEGTPAFDFVATFLHSAKESVREEAALSMGSSRHPVAIALLQATWTAARDPNLRYILLRALSASRQDEAIAFVLDVACNGRKPDVRDAMEALSLHRDSEEIRRRVELAVEDAGSSVQEQYRQAFAKV